MKKVLLIALFLGLLGSCNRSEREASPTGREVKVSGTVGFPVATGSITIQRLRVDSANVETIELNDDYTFEKTIQVTEPGYYQLNFYDKQFVNVVLDKSDITVNVDGNNATGFVEVIGSPDADLVDRVQRIVQGTQNTPEVQQLTQEYSQAAQAKNEELMVEIQTAYLSLLNKGYDSIAEILRNQPPSLSLVSLVMNNGVIDKDKYLDVFMEIAEEVKEEYPEAAFAKEFVEYVDKAKLTAVGQVAPEIALPNPEGEITALSSLRGKYVLVDFWAKWCGPCRQENPNIVKAYNEYKDQGFEVFGVSLDRSKEDWLQGIREDGLPWTHVSDLKYFNSEAAADYNINAIPFSILVNPEGVIVAKNLRGPSLQEKLAEVLN